MIYVTLLGIDIQMYFRNIILFISQNTKIIIVFFIKVLDWLNLQMWEKVTSILVICGPWECNK